MRPFSRHLHGALTGALLASAPLVGLAQGIAFHGGLGFSTTSVRNAAAREQDIAGRGYGMQAATEIRIHGLLTGRVEFGAEYLTPVCLGSMSSGAGDCEAANELSDRATFAAFASTAAGLWSPSAPLPGGSPWRIAVGLFGGAEWVKAGIGQGGCLNCRLEGVDLDGGLFIEPGIELRPGRRYGVAFYYRVFEQGSDLARRVTIRYVSSSL